MPHYTDLSPAEILAGVRDRVLDDGKAYERDLPDFICAHWETIRRWLEVGLGVEGPVPPLRGMKPVVLYFADDEERRAFVSIVNAAKPGMREIRMP